MVQLLEYYLVFTKDCDWKAGNRPIVYQALSKTALDFGVSERQIQKLEKALFEIGALAWNDSGNHRRYGTRDAETGEIIYAYGVDLSPLAALGLVSCLLLYSAQAFAAELRGNVIGVHDGDTITVLEDFYVQKKVRLTEIDAPELSQPFGNQAKQMLSSLVFGKNVTIQYSETDRYGRVLGRVSQGETDVNSEMVARGGAWAYRQYLSDQNIVRAETAAQKKGAGLWALQEDQRIPPWKWRKKERQSEETKSLVLSDTKAGFSCSGKKYCREMSSCAEAKFYLRECGLSRLDGDHDGVPCEKICR